MIINAMFEAAQADGLLLRNPCTKAKRLERKDGTHRALELWEWNIVERMGETDHRFAAAAMTMLYAGLRRGEALALNIDRDVDFVTQTITVRESVRFEGNRPVVVDPKTDAGKRVVPLLSQLADVLRGRHGLLIEMEGGGYLSDIGFKRVWASYLCKCEEMANGGRIRRWYGKLKEDEGKELPPWREFKIRTHDFRHSFCTMLYEAGVDIKSAQKWMGHADENMIMKIYAHLSEEQEKRSENALRQYMLNSQNHSQNENSK